MTGERLEKYCSWRETREFDILRESGTGGLRENLKVGFGSLWLIELQWKMG